MTIFEKIFGISSDEVKTRCVLLPCLNNEILDVFGVKNFKRGKLYGCVNTKDFTLIYTGMGAAFVGDAVLYLKETQCEDVLLFGSCGSLGRLDIGALAAVYECFAYDSFSVMINNSILDAQLYYPDKNLLEAFLKTDKQSKILKARCVTTASLKMEEQYLKKWEEKCFDIVDMECSAFYSAAKSVNIRALSLFYISDIVSKKPFYESSSVQDLMAKSKAIKNGIKMIKEFYA